jgi:MtN3 and saliva related transmembrane protein
MKFIEVWGLVAGILTSSSVLPQIIKTIREKKAEQVSPFMFAVLLTGNAMWIYYGFNKSDFAIISTNILALALSLLMLVLRFKFK